MIFSTIDETIPSKWLCWGKSSKVSDENARNRKKFTVSSLLRQVFISNAKTLDSEVLVSPLFDDDDTFDDGLDEITVFVMHFGCCKVCTLSIF